VAEEGDKSEAEQILGPDVRSPVGIPKQYKPTETSTHQLLRVELGEFAGPLDLLLYLIRQHDLDVFNIPISFITEKYLAMLDVMEGLPIDVAAEFLVMAAELAHIKSKMLLPPKEGVPVEPEEEDEGDPRSDLVRRLLEYQKYRDAAGDLSDRDQLGRDVFTRDVLPSEAAEDFDPGLRDLSIFRLVEAMADVLSRLEPEKQHEVIADTVTISERIRAVVELAEKHGSRLTFKQLFAGMESRRVVVMTFLAILEMARLKMLKIEQAPAAPDPEAEAEEAAPPPAPKPEPAAAPEAAPSDAVPEGEYDGERDAPPAPPWRLEGRPPLVAPEPGEIVLVLTGKPITAEEEQSLIAPEAEQT
jgi:segregation and condensation protein A